MNAGHSALTWLHATQARLQEFDLFERFYSQGVRSFIEAAHPGQATFHPGNSRETMRKYAEAVERGGKPACDLWFIDGDHGPGVVKDGIHAIRSAAPSSVVIFDDCTPRWKEIHGFVNELESMGLLERVERTLPFGPQSQKGWCVGTWAADAKQKAARLLNTTDR